MLKYSSIVTEGRFFDFAPYGRGLPRYNRYSHRRFAP